MKKLLSILLVLSMCFALASCSSEKQEAPKETTENTTSAEEQISVVGQVASTIGDDDKILSIQIQNEEGRWVIYHCTMLDEFVDEAKEYKLTDIAKVKGYLLNEMDSGQENTAILVYLYDCEIVE